MGTATRLRPRHGRLTGARVWMSRNAMAWLTGRDPQSDSRHRDVKGGLARAAVLGAGDGLLTNVSLVLGVVGASTDAGTVRLAGVAGLLAGAFSMAAGELVSLRAQSELVERELQVERQELADYPDAERRELASMYRRVGLKADEAETVAGILSRHPGVALDTHARMELGIDPEMRSVAGRASVVSFLAFSVGALLPLIPWLITGGTGAAVASVVLGAAGALVLGGLVGAFTGRGVFKTAARQLLVASLAAAVTFAAGHLVGVSTR